MHPVHFGCLALLCVVIVRAMDVPPLTTAVGSYYDVGLTVGFENRELIQRRLARSQTTWQYLLSNSNAQQLNESMYKATALVYPQYIEELRGIAAGSTLSFAEVFFLNTMTEIENLQAELSLSTRQTVFVPEHCTDVYASGHTTAESVWGHNEDSGAHDCNVTYLVNATIVVNNSVVERFVAYTYAASVAGRAFGWNRNLIITTNALFPNNNAFDNPSAIPRAFHNRAMYAAASVDEIIKIATSVPTISAFSLNVGVWSLEQPNEHSLPAQYHNVETDPTGAYAVTPIYLRPNASNWAPAALRSTIHHFYHANNYEVLRGNYTVDPDSSARMHRLEEFPVPTTAEDVRVMLGDTKNATWPVWQHGGVSGLFTMATAIFHFESGLISIYAGNPKTSDAVFVLSKL